MAPPSRRLMMLGALALATPALAAPKVVDAKKVFPYLDAYLKLPPADRSRFRLAYAFGRDGRPLTAAVWLVDGAQRQPVPLRADGRAERLPTLAQLERAKVQVDVDSGVKMSISMSIEATVALAADLDARELAAALAQAQGGMKKALGVMALAMPKLEGLRFHGVTGGEIELADGRRLALPVVGGFPFFAPAAQPTARRVRFAKAPSRVEIG